MAKQNPNKDKQPAHLFPITEEDLNEKLPDIKDFEPILPAKSNPLEVKISKETSASPGTNTEPGNNTVNAPGTNNGTEPVKTATTTKPPVKKSAPKKETVVQDDHIEFTIPDNIANAGQEKTTTQTTTQTTQQQNQQTTNVNPDPQTTGNNNNNNNGGQNIFAGGESDLDDDIWNVKSNNGGAKGPNAGGGGNTGAGGPLDGDGVEMPNELMDENVTDLSKTLLILYETFFLAGLKDRAKINVQEFIGDMFAENIDHAYQRDFLMYVLEYNTNIDNDFKLSLEKKKAIEHAVKILLNKYSGFAEKVGPEIQALLLLGNVLKSDYQKSNRWINPGKRLLDQIDERLKYTPKNPMGTAKASTVKEEQKNTTTKKKDGDNVDTTKKKP